MLNRKAAREQAFVLIFEKIFNDLSCDEIIDLAVDVREFETDEYCVSVFTGVYDNIEKIDALISENANGWNISRLGKVALAVMRLAIFELLFRDDIPASVSVNEAVELCKKFATTEDASFVNGVLGSVVKKVAGDK
ncbi:MAG: transcription antitermination factor NusB [Ruminococcaceae bacterium]|nr:transcription antitermination factor NusB [Oscillospiraceae bacterium]